MSLSTFAAEKTVVTIVREDGREFTGTPVATDEPNVFAIRSGKRGRPARVHVDDVTAVHPRPAIEAAA